MAGAGAGCSGALPSRTRARRTMSPARCRSPEMKVEWTGESESWCGLLFLRVGESGGKAGSSGTPSIGELGLAGSTAVGMSGACM